MTPDRLRLATRGSALALAQSELVAESLRQRWPGLEVELHLVVTEGDRRRDVATSELVDFVPDPTGTSRGGGGSGRREVQGKGVFTAGVQRAVLAGRADFAVHSAKDLPAEQVPGLVLAAVPEREDPRDVLLGPEGALSGLSALAEGARVGTGSPRRAALIAADRPDLKIVAIRGNVDSRVRRVRAGELEAVVLAAAGLRRLGMHAEAAQPLAPSAFIPAPGQGCLAIEAREDDTATQGLLGALTHRPSRIALRGERAFLAKLGGSCTLPAGAMLTVGETRLEMVGFLAAEDGRGMVRERLAGPSGDPEGLGAGLAWRLLGQAGPEVARLVENSRK